MSATLAHLAELPDVGDAAAAARAAVDAVIAHPVLRRRGGDAALESALRGARASAALDGVDVDLEFLRSGHMRLDHPGRPVAQAALRLNQEVPLLDVVWRRSAPEALARLHVLAASDLVDDGVVGSGDTGESAASPVVVGRPRRGRPIDGADAPSPGEVAARLAVLTSVIREDTTTPAVIVAAVVHGELLALRAFGARDALVARAAERLVLRTRGLDPRSLTVPEAGHAREGRTAYLARAEGFAEGSPDAVRRWLIGCADAVRHGADESQRALDSLDAS